MKAFSKYRWQPDLPDDRDFPYTITTTTPLPPKIDLRDFCSNVEDQGNLGSCTGNAIVGALEVLENINKGKFEDLSRLFVYYNERLLEGTVKQDSGAYIRDGIKVVAASGCCTETLWPYNIAKFKNKPLKKCYADGAKRKISVYKRLNTVAEMKDCLAKGFPFVFGFSVYSSFETQEVANTGTAPMPKKGEQLLGGHAVLCVGFDDVTQRFLIRNSWGTGWGDKGYFTLPYDYLANRNLSDDFWTVSK